jgi:acetylglutamate kinase
VVSELALAGLDRATPQARAIGNALEGGVERVHVIDGRVPHNLIAELFTDRGVGTLVVR